MKKILLFLLALVLVAPVVAAGLPPPGAPGHADPYGKYMLDHHLSNQEDGWWVAEHRSAFVDSDTFIFQLYSSSTPDVNYRKKVEFYWTMHEVGELLDTIGPFYGIEFTRYWPASSGESRTNVFSKSQLDAPMTVVRTLKPFDRDIISIDISDYKLINRIKLPEYIQAWSIADLDKDGEFELICVNTQFSDMFPTRNKPHCLCIYKMDNNGLWYNADSDFPDTINKWDSELLALAESSKDESRIEHFSSLALSYFVRNKSDEEISSIEALMVDDSGYTNKEDFKDMIEETKTAILAVSVATHD
ncbi:MAG TPA: hypothetical protein PKV16_00745 [Caldisericia bacterium]|nr:hypothetical protein [Caldisericia bacterium]HPI83076.1 hypothetical protein [Caldisericia bacterium]HPQ92303.1 hypothetical protein [Caldisericia bacterium]